MKVTASRKTRVVAGEPGESLLDACDRADLAVDFACRGGMCMRCLVRVDDQAPLDEVSATEARRLGEDRQAMGYRLACVARFRNIS